METLKAFTTILTTLVVSSICFCQTQVEVQEVKELKRTGNLSTCGYRATDRETPFLQKLPASEKTSGSFMDKQEYRIRGKVKQYVSWFGVVRGSSPAKGDERNRDLLIQQKYFDGMTDCHIMLVSNAGAGDFVGKLMSNSEAVPVFIACSDLRDCRWRRKWHSADFRRLRSSLALVHVYIHGSWAWRSQ